MEAESSQIFRFPVSLTMTEPMSIPFSDASEMLLQLMGIETELMKHLTEVPFPGNFKEGTLQALMLRGGEPQF